MKLTTENTEFTEENYPHSEITAKIIKCAIEVHQILGPGFIENIYEKALIREMVQAGLKVDEQVTTKVNYKGSTVGEHRLDFVIENAVIVENKTVKDFDETHKARVLSYLKATGKRVGLLINFAKKRIDVKRIVL